MEVVIFCCAANVALAVVEGKGAVVVAQTFVGADDDGGRCVLGMEDAKGMAEECRGVEVLGQEECLFRRSDTYHAVQRKRSHAAIGEPACQQIPALAEELQAPRLCLYAIGLGISELLVFDVDCMPVFHGSGDFTQEGLSRGHMLQQNAFLDVAAFAYYASNGHGAEHPVLQIVAVQFLCVAEEILIAERGLTAFHLQMECVFDGLAIAFETVTVDGNAVTELCPCPLCVQCFQSDAVVTAYGVDNPYIGLEQTCYLYHISCFFMQK